ncbi:MAG TPA: HAMP domain-containing sensor histidine kinase [Vulgatibacter sp.]|nr:HAMP domain-containing sensor histidine kinase [Vulgatibacter sp.]
MPTPFATMVELFSRSPHGVAILEWPGQRLRWVNDSFKAWAGDVPSLAGMPLEKLLPGFRSLLPVIRTMRREGKAQSFHQLAVGAHCGASRWITGVVAPVDGYIVLDFHDSTAKMQALEVSLAGEQLLEQVPFPVALIDARGAAIRVSQRAQTRLGLEPGQVASTIPAVIQLQDNQGHRLDAEAFAFRRLSKGETVEVRGSLWDRLLGERRDCVIYGAPIRVRGRPASVLLVSIDVTDLRQLERAKDEFINVAGHELRTPLTAARTYLQLALRKGLDHADAQTMIENAIIATKRMQRLINDILETERLETGRLELRLEHRDLAATIEEALDREQRQLGDERKLEIRIEGPLVAEHDPVRVEQILHNLISNAVRYSRFGEPVRVRAFAEKTLARVEVEDDGDGIAEDEIPWVFDRLFRGHKSRGDGLGVGLYVAKLLVELHGGRIGVTSGPGRGARFFFYLPLAD